MSRRKSMSQPETLEEVLNTYTVDILKKLAKLVARGLPTRKAELISVIREVLDSPKKLQQLWDQLDTLQQTAVAEVVHSAALRFDRDKFSAKYSAQPDWGKIDRYNTMDAPSLLRLFIFGDIMPRDLRDHLQSFVEQPSPAELRTVEKYPAAIEQSRNEFDAKSREYRAVTEEVPLQLGEGEEAALHDFHAVLRLIDAGKISVGAKSKKVSAAGVTAIDGVLHAGDYYAKEEDIPPYVTDPGPIRAFAWPLILQSAGFANLKGSKLYLTPAGKKALAAPAFEGLRTAWQRWQKTDIVDEFSRIHTIKGQTGKGKRSLTKPASRRQVIIDALKTCPTMKWLAFDEFSRFMRATDHFFEVTSDPWSLYIADSHYGSLGYAGYHDWNILQERYMMAFLFEYAATMGLVDIAYIHPSGARDDYGDMWGTDDEDCLSRYDGLLYFRLNDLGAWCLGTTHHYAPPMLERQQLLDVSSDLEIVARAPLPPGDQLFLDRFAKKMQEGKWKLQTEKLLEAVEQGHVLDDIWDFLFAKSGGRLPNPVRKLFHDLAERISLLKNRGAALLIDVAEPSLARSLADDRRLRSLCMVAGERHLVVPAKSEKAFRKALRSLGYVLPE